ncbi:hypothetical protein A33Q_2433 [Indibacter alkaliphilus LW1]|uniref:Uncharacterized protein n=1 Tax=Indibacter alkaliphilus (strain CCUG 57479 / KCTC 22604 / LW1) TaxID=1189612 RepID=S2E3D5_INDAL|nr:hypothetical protein A33Q_2433 [Indibacter alkaliphilus LW1]
MSITDGNWQSIGFFILHLWFLNPDGHSSTKRSEYQLYGLRTMA